MPRAHRAGADRPRRARSARAGVSSGTSAIFAAARSAKNAWRSARDSGVCSSCTNSCALDAQALVERQRRRGRRPRRRTRAAPGSPWRRAATVLRANWKKPRRSDARTVGRARACSGTLRRRRPRAQARARPRADRRRRSRRTAPCPVELAAGTVAPDTIMLSAVSTPIARGRRCVPPAPGRRPSLTSGSAICAPGVATR